VSNSTLSVQGTQVEHVTVEGTLNKLTDGFLIDKFVRKVSPLRL